MKNKSVINTNQIQLLTTTTVYNYYYIRDFIFYPNGVMEAKMHASLYVQSTLYYTLVLRVGFRLV
ncbi:copper amine oxidase [Klebsiella pneumoniae]|uniref:copper amine oxidase n=1 Tax=Klebsiella pneumoniae TaxID=573 RepID=UPI00351DB31B